jgi:hypothetical protein
MANHYPIACLREALGDSSSNPAVAACDKDDPRFVYVLSHKAKGIFKTCY